MKNYNQLALEKWNEGERNKTVIAREVKEELGLSSNVEQLRKNISKYINKRASSALFDEIGRTHV